MKPLALLLCSSLAPVIIAELSLAILVPELWMDTAKIVGKNTSDSDIFEMNRAINNPDSSFVCPSEIDGLVDSPECTPRFAGVTHVRFSDPTDQPRPLNITMGDYSAQVSATLVAHNQTDSLVHYLHQGYR
jgi:hypothetical protein